MSGFFRVAGPLGLAEAPFASRGVGANDGSRIAPPALSVPPQAEFGHVAATSTPDTPADFDPYGAYDVRLPYRLSLTEIAALARHTGIHPDVLGPCRRTAAKLGWVLMFRAIKPAAMEYVGQYNMLPKPPALKVKCHEQLGVIAYSGPDKEAQYQNDVRAGKIDGVYNQRQGLHLDMDGTAAGLLGIRPPPDTVLLVDREGRGFYSDMDMFQVLDARAGKPVSLGSGGPDDRAGPERARLDSYLNILASLGIEFGLIQHGAERQWSQHAPKNERVAAFGPDGAIWSFESYDSVVAFEEYIVNKGYRRMFRHFGSFYRGG
jgi:hypothetical protein